MLSEGKMLFENAHRGRNGNGFSCIICHDSGIDGEDGLIRPGHTMMNAFNRPSWKNGNVDQLLEAVNTCLSDWMNADTLSEDDLLWEALETYIRFISPDLNSKPISIQIVTPPDPPTGGNFERGEQLIQQLACIDCHGKDLRGVMDDTGGLLAPYLIERPEIPLDHDYIAAKIRVSGSNLSGSYEGLSYGGNMPFWGANRISDQDVRDIAEYLAVASRWIPAPQDTPTPTNTPTQTPVSPQATPTPQPPSTIQPGWTADFGTGNSHRVGGKVTVLDEDTIQLENFQYDGGGIAVALYLIKATGQNFTSSEGRAGVSILNFTLGECYGLNDTCTIGNFTIDIPSTINLSDYTHISVWCVPVGVSFGHGKFTSP
jgi:cytochrome c